MTSRPDVIVLMTDEERAAPSYESDALRSWRQRNTPGTGWFDDHAVAFGRHYTGSLACVPRSLRCGSSGGIHVHDSRGGRRSQHPGPVPR